MDPFTLSLDDLTLHISYAAPWRYQPSYMVTVDLGGQCAQGWVRCKELSLQSGQLASLDFYEAPGWLRRAIAPQPARDGACWGRWQLSPGGVSPLSLFPPAAMTRLLSAWLATDYRRRFFNVVMAIEAGLPVDEDYHLLWYFALCHEAGINLLEEPTPAELVAAFRLVEAGSSREIMQQAEKRRRWSRISRRAQEMARWNTWVGEHLAGLVPISVFPCRLLWQGGVCITFQTSRYETPTAYEHILLDGVDAPVGYFERFGQHILAYVPPEIAERWYAERWEMERGPCTALYALSRALSGAGGGSWGDDYACWVFQREGESSLVALARAGTPVDIAWPHAYTCAIASKWYRIPLCVDLDGDRQVGYGVPGICCEPGQPPIPMAEERWPLMLRLYGWVTLGGEEKEEWPAREDIDAYRVEVARHSMEFPV